MSLKLSLRSRSNSRSKSREKDAKYISAAIIPSAAFIANPTAAAEIENLNNLQRLLLSNTLNSSVPDDSQDLSDGHHATGQMNNASAMPGRDYSTIDSADYRPKDIEAPVALESQRKTRKKASRISKPRQNSYEDPKRHIEIANGLSIHNSPDSGPYGLKKPDVFIYDNYEYVSDKVRSVENPEQPEHTLHLIESFRNKPIRPVYDVQTIESNNNVYIHQKPKTHLQSIDNLKSQFLIKDQSLEVPEQIIDNNLDCNAHDSEYQKENKKIGFESFDSEIHHNIGIGFEENPTEKNLNQDNDPITLISNDVSSQSYFAQKTSPKTANKQLRTEIRLLQDTIYRLNMELSEKIPISEPGQAVGKTVFPGKGPVPSWLMNTKYLAPLFVVYDRKHRDQLLKMERMQIEINNFEKEIRQIIKENESLHLKLQENQKCGFQGNQSQCQVIVQQAKLVIEENHLLLEEIDLQRQKIQIYEKSHTPENAQLKKSLLAVTAERDALDQEIKHLTQQIGELKRTNQPLHHPVEDSHEYQNTDHPNDIPSNIQKLLESQINGMKKDKEYLELEIINLKEKEKKQDTKLAKYKKVLESEKKFRDYFNNVLDKTDDVLNDRNILIESLEAQNKEISRIAGKLAIEINCLSNLDINEYDNIKFRENKNDGYKSQISSIESLTNILLQSNADMAKKCNSHENDIYKYQNLLKEKDKLLQECQQENYEMEEKLEKLLKNANSEY